jgi:hypothetical protein
MALAAAADKLYALHNIYIRGFNKYLSINGHYFTYYFIKSAYILDLDAIFVKFYGPGRSREQIVCIT